MDTQKVNSLPRCKGTMNYDTNYNIGEFHYVLLKSCLVSTVMNTIRSSRSACCRNKYFIFGCVWISGALIRTRGSGVVSWLEIRDSSFYHLCLLLPTCINGKVQPFLQLLSIHALTLLCPIIPKTHWLLQHVHLCYSSAPAATSSHLLAHLISALTTHINVFTRSKSKLLSLFPVSTPTYLVKSQEAREIILTCASSTAI